MKKIKIIILLVFINIFSGNICFAEYHKVNEDGTEISTSTVEELNLQFPDRETGKLKSELDSLNQEDVSMNIINYKKPYFWALLFALILIVFILIRLFKKLSHMDKEFKKYENKIKKKNNDEEIVDADEIVYSINETNNIKPEIQESKQTSEIKITTPEIDSSEEQEMHQKIEIQDESVEQKLDINKKDGEEDDDYIFEEE